MVIVWCSVELVLGGRVTAWMCAINALRRGLRDSGRGSQSSKCNCTLKLNIHTITQVPSHRKRPLPLFLLRHATHNPHIRRPSHQPANFLPGLSSHQAKCHSYDITLVP
ncbi:hypothetical protein BDW02DRAFT_566038 [Decorospora gaudefroyi]|uniref:Secreted protein n=1 Tax=Decorospora gaudefroyi TaxID=184978 RepID=A0A6A5KPZ3_9PLEO|nr:hypothetical protein BDW02DRAFT_566038 [Decorospora gaudefroyi]